MPYPFGQGTRQILFYLLPALLVVLALVQPLVARAGRTAARLHGAALALVVLLGFGLYTNANWENRRYFNPYEFFHYYVGGKYARELGYTRLYDAAALVDRETQNPERAREIVNLGAREGDPEFRLVSEVYAEAALIRAPFGAQRWQEFRDDVVLFRDEMPPDVWRRALHDKGYNATPVWTLLGGSLAGLVPARAAASTLVWLDVALLGASFGLVAWAFGARAMAFALALYLTHYCTSHAHFRAAYLRTDWLFALTAGLCCLRKERPFTAGALLAVSSLLRIFPLLFALGPLIVLLLALVRSDDPRRRAALRFATGFAGFGALLFGASLLYPGGLGPWLEFQDKIVEHDERPASDTLGFKKLFLWTLDYRADQGREMRARFEELRPAWWAVQALVAAGFAWLVRRRSLAEALGLAFVLVWMLASPAYYYYAFLVVPLLHGAARATTLPGALVMASVFATSLVARAVHGGAAFAGHFAFKLSCAMGALCLVLVATEVASECAAARRAAARSA